MDNAQTADSGREAEDLPGAVLTLLGDMRLTLSLLNRRVAQHFRVNEVDLDCLDLLTRHGPHAPTRLARRLDLHLATMTGVLDRLERGGWIVRERSHSDRRRVLVHATEQSQQITTYYLEAAQELRALCAAFPAEELQTVSDFLRRASLVQLSGARMATTRSEQA